MASWHKGITPRRSVHSTEDMRTHKRHDGSLKGVGFESYHLEIIKNKIEGWPQPLRDEYHRCSRHLSKKDSLYEMYQTLKMLMKNENLPAEHHNLVLDCISDYQCINNEIYVNEAASYKTRLEDVPQNQQNPLKRNLILYFAIPLGLVFLAYYFWNDVIEPDNSHKIEEWTQNIRDLQKKFPSQNEDIWFDIVSGVKTIVTENPTKPSVLLLLHNDKRTSDCLASKVGKEAVKLLSDTLQEPIIIRGEDLKLNKSLTKDFGLFSDTYKYDIENKHVMIVLDLQEIPAVLAQTFHVLCDKENPLVHNAAFLFTMLVDGYDFQHPTDIAEKHLKILWKDTLDNDIMEPLITRITDAVVTVKLEAHLPC